jgi:hypothetical protein
MKIKMNFTMLRNNAAGLVEIVEGQIFRLLAMPFPSKGELATEEYLGTYESLLITPKDNFVELNLKWNEFNCQLRADLPKEFWEDELDANHRKDIRLLVERMVNYWMVRYSMSMLIKIIQDVPQLSEIIDNETWGLMNEFYPGFYIETTNGGYKYKSLLPDGTLLRSHQVEYNHHSLTLPNFSRGFIDFTLGNGKLNNLVISPSNGKPDIFHSFGHEIFDHVLEDLAVLGLQGYLTHDAFTKRITI